MLLVAIDPSITDAGIALFKDSELQWARGVHCKTTKDPKETRYKVMSDSIKGALNGLVPDVLVLEFPEIYPRCKARPNDLMQLAGLVGYLAGTIPAGKVITYLPKQWKRQIKKEVCVRMIQGKLTAEERARVTDGGKTDAWDACGLGLTYLKRFL